MTHGNCRTASASSGNQKSPDRGLHFRSGLHGDLLLLTVRYSSQLLYISWRPGRQEWWASVVISSIEIVSSQLPSSQ